MLRNLSNGTSGLPRYTYSFGIYAKGIFFLRHFMSFVDPRFTEKWVTFSHKLLKIIKRGFDLLMP